MIIIVNMGEGVCWLRISGNQHAGKYYFFYLEYPLLPIHSVLLSYFMACHVRWVQQHDWVSAGLQGGDEISLCLMSIISKFVCNFIFVTNHLIIHLHCIHTYNSSYSMLLLAAIVKHIFTGYCSQSSGNHQIEGLFLSISFWKEEYTGRTELA